MLADWLPYALSASEAYRTLGKERAHPRPAHPPLPSPTRPPLLPALLSLGDPLRPSANLGEPSANPRRPSGAGDRLGAPPPRRRGSSPLRGGGGAAQGSDTSERLPRHYLDRRRCGSGQRAPGGPEMGREQFETCALCAEGGLRAGGSRLKAAWRWFRESPPPPFPRRQVLVDEEIRARASVRSRGVPEVQPHERLAPPVDAPSSRRQSLPVVPVGSDARVRPRRQRRARAGLPPVRPHLPLLFRPDRDGPLARRREEGARRPPARLPPPLRGAARGAATPIFSISALHW